MSKETRQQKKQMYQINIEPQAQMNLTYGILMAVSGVLAAVAFLVNSIPMLIGSMVIAPVMPPLVLMAIGLANGNFKSIVKGCGIAVSGLLFALIFTIATVWVLNIVGITPPQLQMSPMLVERVSPGWYSVVAAVAAGIAGALAVLYKKTDTLVGVVASIALVPTVAAAAIAAVIGDWQSMTGGFIMLGINVAIIVLVGWIVFTVFSQT